MKSNTNNKELKMNDVEHGRCAFCGNMKDVSRFYIDVKNKHFDDNKQGKYHEYILYCRECDIDTDSITDGYHTFKELYAHRVRLFIELCRTVRKERYVWCSKFHSDGSRFDRWVILGIGSEFGKQITYHVPEEYWDELCSFASVLERAPKWDAHTSGDVLARLKDVGGLTLYSKLSETWSVGKLQWFFMYGMMTSLFIMGVGGDFGKMIGVIGGGIVLSMYAYEYIKQERIGQ